MSDAEWISCRLHFDSADDARMFVAELDRLELGLSAELVEGHVIRVSSPLLGEDRHLLVRGASSDDEAIGIARISDAAFVGSRVVLVDDAVVEVSAPADPPPSDEVLDLMVSIAAFFGGAYLEIPERTEDA